MMPVDQVLLSPWTRKHDLPGSSYIPEAPKTVYPKTLEDLIDICKNRQIQQRLKAAGSHWALSDAAVSDYTFIELHDPTNTHQAIGRTLTDVVPGCLHPQVLDMLGNNHNPTFTLVHIEAGKRIYQLYAELDQVADLTDEKTLAGYMHQHYNNAAYQSPWMFETLGDAGGQTIVGALTTGTHGGDFRRPPIADSVVALHLVADGGKHYWIEPYSGQFHLPIWGSPHLTDDGRLIALYGDDKYGGAENFTIVRDDDFFNAAIVSVGRFGIIYSVVLRAVPQYSLHEQRRLTTWQAVRHRIPHLNTDLYEEPSIPVHAARYLQIAVLATPKSNFAENLAGVTKRWNVPNASPPPGRAERVGRKIQSFSTLAQAPVFEFAGNSFPYSPGHPRGAFFDHACAYSDLLVGLLEAALQAVEDLIDSGIIQPIFKDIAKIGLGLPLLGPAWEAIRDLIKDLIDDLPDMRLAEAMDKVREALLEATRGTNVEALGLFMWQVIANELFKVLQADDDLEAISYTIMDSHHYLDVNCRTNVDSIEVFFGVEEPTVWNLIAFVDALLEFEKQQEFNGKAFFGYISLRFTGKTSALIGMERSDVTCAVEIACLKDMKGSQEMIDYAEKLARDPNVHGIIHWGQRNNCTRGDIERIFGDSPSKPGGDLQKWRTALSAITDNGKLDGFSSEFTRRTGLEVVQPKIQEFFLSYSNPVVGQTITLAWDCQNNPPGTEVSIELDAPHANRLLLNQLPSKGTHQFVASTVGPHQFALYATLLERKDYRFKSVTVS